MPVRKLHLANNITLITQPDVNAKVTAFGFYFAAGSRFEGRGEYGISHFTEHLLFKGTSSRSNSDISRIFDRMGAVFNAFTEREAVGVYCTVPSENEENFRTALDILCDLSCCCTFPPEELEKERRVVQNEILSVKDDPDDSAMDEAACTVWPGQDISRTITGTAADVAAITREQIVSWYGRYFVHGELAVIVCGKIYDGILVPALEKLPLHAAPVPVPSFGRRHFPQEPCWSPQTRVVKAPFSQTQVFVLYPLKAELSETDYFSLMVFNLAAGEAMSSRLFSALRERDGLCYSVGSFFTVYEGAGAWCAYAVCERKNAACVFQKMRAEISGFLQNQITDGEIEIAKERLCGTEIVSEARTSFLMQRLWNFYSMGFPLRETEDVLAAVRSLKKSDIISFIQSLLDEEKRAALVYGPALCARVKKEILCKSKVK